MATRKTKFSISIKDLNIQFEGDQDTGQHVQAGIQDALGGMLEMQGRVLGNEDQRSVIDVTPSTPSKPARRRKRTAFNPEVNGERTSRQAASRQDSIPSQLTILLDEHFFRIGQKVGAVKDALTNRGYNFKQNSVSMALKKLTQDGKLKRAKDEKGEFVYTAK